MKNQKRIVTFFIFVGLFSASYFIGSQSEVSHEDALTFQEEFNNLIEDIDGIGIFLHNSVVALPMFIPGFGIAWGFFSSWQTGQAFAALALLNPIISDIHPLAILYASPFGIMELAAYSIAMSRSLLLIHKIIKKIPIKNDYKIIGIEVGIVVGLLLAGGFLEAYLIQVVEDSGIEAII
ncbi:MAG: stage II sporulation protein M [Nitrosopumilaceae archaeon]